MTTLEKINENLPKILTELGQEELTISDPIYDLSWYANELDCILNNIQQPGDGFITTESVSGADYAFMYFFTNIKINNEYISIVIDSIDADELPKTLEEMATFIDELEDRATKLIQSLKQYH